MPCAHFRLDCRTVFRSPTAISSMNNYIINLILLCAFCPFQNKKLKKKTQKNKFDLFLFPLEQYIYIYLRLKHNVMVKEMKWCFIGLCRYTFLCVCSFCLGLCLFLIAFWIHFRIGLLVATMGASSLVPMECVIKIRLKNKIETTTTKNNDKIIIETHLKQNKEFTKPNT